LLSHPLKFSWKYDQSDDEALKFKVIKFLVSRQDVPPRIAKDISIIGEKRFFREYDSLLPEHRAFLSQLL